VKEWEHVPGIFPGTIVTEHPAAFIAEAAELNAVEELEIGDYPLRGRGEMEVANIRHGASNEIMQTYLRKCTAFPVPQLPAGGIRRRRRTNRHPVIETEDSVFKNGQQPGVNETVM
jgi:hypothetical protein